MKLNEKLEKVRDHLEQLDAPQFDHIEFEWEGIHFTASSKTTPQGQNQVELKAALGRLCFSIENPYQRSMALDQLFTTNRKVDGRYNIARNGDIHFSSITRTDGPQLGESLVSALTIILLEAEVHLRSLKAHLKDIPAS